METNPALKMALHYASKGWYVFPVGLNKKPFAGFDWGKDKLATIDPDKIHEYAAKYPGCNWALDCGRSNKFVLDVDMKHGNNGFAELAKYTKSADTNYKVRTPNGDGYHYHYEGLGLTKADELPGLDSRSLGGYVLIPGSIAKDEVTGEWKRYELVEDGPLGAIPEWMPKVFTERKEVQQLPTPEGFTFDEPHNVTRVTEWLKNQPPIQKGSRNNSLFNMACQMKDFGLSEGKTLELLSLWNLERVYPPVKDRELQIICNSGAKSKHSAPGSKTPEAMFGAPAIIVPPPKVDFTNMTEDELDRLYGWGKAGSIAAGLKCINQKDFSTIPQREFLLQNRFAPGFVTATIAPGGVGKSSFSILEALAVATGRNLTFNEVIETGPVILFNMEDPEVEIERRLAAAFIYHGIDKTKCHNIYHFSARNREKIFCGDLTGQTATINDQTVNETIYILKKLKARLLIIDPFIGSHNLNENDNMHIYAVAEVFRYIAEETYAAVSLVHHARKKSSDSGRGELDSARGASALGAACRIAHTLDYMSEKEAGPDKYNIPGGADRRRWHISLNSAKMNLGEESSSNQWYGKGSVKLQESHTQTVQAFFKETLSEVETRPPENELLCQIHNAIDDDKEYSFTELKRMATENNFVDKSSGMILKYLNKIFEKDFILENKQYHVLAKPAKTNPKNFTTYILRTKINDNV